MDPEGSDHAREEARRSLLGEAGSGSPFVCPGGHEMPPVLPVECSQCDSWVAYVPFAAEFAARKRLHEVERLADLWSRTGGVELRGMASDLRRVLRSDE